MVFGETLERKSISHIRPKSEENDEAGDPKEDDDCEEQTRAASYWRPLPLARLNGTS